MRQLSISSGPAATLLVTGDSDNPIPTLIQNVDVANVLYLGEHVSVNPALDIDCAPLNPGQSTVASGAVNIFGIAAPGQSVAVNVYVGVMSFFQPISQLAIAGPSAAILIYTPVAGPGNLVGSWSGASTPYQDGFGNTVPPGLNAQGGDLVSMILDAATLNNPVLFNAQLNDAVANTPQITGGTVTETAITFDTTGGFLFLYASTTTTVTFNTAGRSTWVSPVTALADVRVWGGDAGAGGGSPSRGGEGGGAGEFAEEPNYLLTSGQSYFVDVGGGGTGGNTGAGGTNAGDSGFDSFAVLAGGGKAGSGFVGGAGGNKSTNTRHFKGGNGGGDGSQSTGGCGGGGRAGLNGPGGNGAKSTSSSGAAGGAAGSGTGGIAGANGGASGANGNNGPAAGSGCGAATSAATGSNTYGLTTSSYYGSDATGGNANGRRVSAGSPYYQGGESASGGSFNGTQKSLLVINGNPQSDLSGKIIDTVTVTMTCQHSWYNSGMTVYFGYNGRSSAPSSWDGSDITTVGSAHADPSGNPIAYDLSGLGLGSAMQSGAAKSVTIGPGSGNLNLNNYGFFSGTGSGQGPTVTVNWHTGSTPVKAGNGGTGLVTVTYTNTQVLVGAVSPVAGNDAAGNAFAVGYTGPVQAFQPNTTPTVAEVWHDLPPGINGWGLGTGGWKKYRMLPTGSVELSISLRLIGTKTDGTNIFGPGALPTGYQPANIKLMSCIGTQNALSANWPQTISFNTDGSISIRGINATTFTQLDFHGTVPLI